MKPRRAWKLHSLRRPKIRQTWSKYNLYNLSRLRENQNSMLMKTFFQQKWAAKSALRAYHGEHIKEGHWERMFSRRLLSVVDMKPDYMARYDGSEQAAGRGSGLTLDAQYQDPDATNRDLDGQPTPYMLMAFAPQERRLDIAIYRALFASSAREARMFVVHGAVRVNGVKMIHPSYLLNPGDMFQVDPDRVMAATGKQKLAPTKQYRNLLKRKGITQLDQEAFEEVLGREKGAEVTEGANTTGEGEKAEPITPEGEAKELKALFEQVQSILRKDSGQTTKARDWLNVKKKRQLRALMKSVRAAMSRANRNGNMDTHSDDVVAGLVEMLGKLDIGAKDAKLAAKHEARDAESSEREGLIGISTILKKYPNLSQEEQSRLNELLKEEAENPVDDTKPYYTPWEPRPYMAPFAFIPRYLEVNQNICAAVYLRHPVARPGLAEVPTPLSQFMGQLAFNWYLRRR